jgi:hypothetical protein
MWRSANAFVGARARNQNFTSRFEARCDGAATPELVGNAGKFF